MTNPWLAWILLAIIALSSPAARAAEGPTIAGPIGGTDIRSAQLPPAGLYGGMILLGSPAYDFVDGQGKTVAGLEIARLTKYFSAPFLLYVPDLKLLGGSIGIAGILPNGAICGRLFANETSDCTMGMGDPYFEFIWSRPFGHFRPSKYADALPIFDGLTVAAGLGLVVPLGQFDANSPTKQARSTGTNIYDIAPTIAATYTTPALFVDGTEFSAKFYWNKYLENTETQYLTGSIASLDFAVSERVGRFQFGVAGNYLVQLEDDKRFGISVPPDGKRAESLTLGGILNVDVPEYGASVKLKTQSTIYARNAAKFWGISIGWVRKF